MSLQAMLWALNDAPTADPTHVLVLVALADRASDDGTDAYPSQKNIAWRARVSTRTVRRVLSALEQEGLIRRGDQSRTAQWKTPFRPTVWDLAIERKRPKEGEQAPDQEGPDEELQAATDGHLDNLTSRTPASFPGGHGRPQQADTAGHITVLQPSFKGSARSEERPPAAPAGEPPRRCSKHEGTNHDGACGACGDARRSYDSWVRAAKPKASTYVPQQKCLDHPTEPAGRCGRCASEAVRPKRSLREMYQAAR